MFVNGLKHTMKFLKRTNLVIAIIAFFFSGLWAVGQTVDLRPGFESFTPDAIYYEGTRDSQWNELSEQIFLDSVPPSVVDRALWSSFVLRNEYSDTLELVFNMARNEFHEVFVVRDGTEVKRLETGFLVPKSRRNDSFYSAVMLELAPGVEYTIYHLTYNRSNNPVYSYQRVVNREEFSRGWYDDYDRFSTAMNIQLFFLGATFILFAYFFILWIQSGTKSYLAYSVYLVFGFLYILLKIDTHPTNDFIFTENPIWRFHLNEPLQVISFAAYNWFAVEFLDLRKYIPRITRFIQWVSIAYVSYAIFHLVFTVTTLNAAITGDFFMISRGVMFPVGLFLIVIVAIKVRTILTAYLIVGSSIYFFGLALAFLHSTIWWENGWFDNWFAINYMEVGMLGEILLFSLGIGHKIRLTALDKEEYQSKLIEQLRLNEKLSAELNTQLNEAVRRKTEEFKKQALELEKAREKELRLQYEQKIVMSEIQSLRLQMNPHFLFNAMNSIRYYILKKDRKEASNYITRFSRLLRLILKNSRKAAIPIEDELQSIRLYVEFEQMRFDQKFEFKLEIDDNLNSDNIFVQPMIVQPFVENAIWHGLMQKEGADGSLMVRYERVDSRIRVVIDDNGIGRERARELKSKGLTQKSFGLQITESRLKMMGHIQEDEQAFQIIDKKNAQGHPQGTKVIVYLKIERNPEENQIEDYEQD